LQLSLGLAIATPAYAGFLDGNELYQTCKDGRRWMDGANLRNGPEQSPGCRSYVLGVVDTFMLAGDRAEKCDMTNVTAGQLVDVTIKYLADHPDMRQRSASALTAFALNTAFCRN